MGNQWSNEYRSAANLLQRLGTRCVVLPFEGIVLPPEFINNRYGWIREDIDKDKQIYAESYAGDLSKEALLFLLALQEAGILIFMGARPHEKTQSKKKVPFRNRQAVSLILEKRFGYDVSDQLLIREDIDESFGFLNDLEQRYHLHASDCLLLHTSREMIRQGKTLGFTGILFEDGFDL